MKYFIYVTETFAPNNIAEIYSQIDSGFFSIFCKNSKSFFHIFCAYKNLCLTKSFEDKISLEYFPQLKFLKKLKSHTVRRVRRKDFIMLTKLFHERIKNIKTNYFLSLLPSKIILNINSEENNLAYALSTHALRQEISILINQFYAYFQNSLAGDSFAQEQLFRLIRQIKQEKLYLPIYNAINTPMQKKRFENYTIYLQGKSFKEMIFYRSILAGEKRFVRFSHFNQKLNVLPSNFFISTQEKKIKINKIVIVTSESGRNLHNLLNIYKLIQNSGFEVKRIFQISGNYSLEEFKLQMKSALRFIPNGLFIYQGHSKVKNGRLHWKIKNDYYPVPNGMEYYLHLSCVELESSQDLFRFPAKKSFLPMSLLPDLNLTKELKIMFQLLSKKHNFATSAEQAFASVKINRMPAFVSVSSVPQHNFLNRVS